VIAYYENKAQIAQTIINIIGKRMKIARDIRMRFFRSTERGINKLKIPAIIVEIR
jgi:hypothetical protein